MNLGRQFWKFENPVLFVGEQGCWDGLAISEPTLVWDGELYRMYYEGLGSADKSWRVGLALSRDLVNWKRHPDNPILVPQDTLDWCDKDVLEPFVMKIDDQYHMWFTANLADTAERSEIGYARSADGLTWNVEPEPCISFAQLEESGTRFTGASEPAVIRRPVFGDWIMYFQTWRYGISHIGYALSDNGESWTIPKEGNPVIRAGLAETWDGTGVAGPDVAIHQGTYYMFYNSWRNPEGAQIGLAVSPDGVHFARFPGNPILSPTPSLGKALYQVPWDQHSVYEPGIWVDANGGVVVLYGGLRLDTGAYDEKTRLQIGAAFGRLPDIPLTFGPQEDS
jgi:predicted GH43/DUF377 family glycosyl hydrolase